ncbi:MAG: AzlD domain-containing protein [Xanthobacteraceae bacterium]
MTDWARPEVLAAIAVMVAVTVASRLGGYWLMRYVTVTPRVRRMLDALPGSIILAAVAPVAVNGGAVVMLAIGAAVAVAILTRSDFLAVAVGMALAAAVRALGLD